MIFAGCSSTEFVLVVMRPSPPSGGATYGAQVLNNWGIHGKSFIVIKIDRFDLISPEGTWVDNHGSSLLGSPAFNLRRYCKTFFSQPRSQQRVGGSLK